MNRRTFVILAAVAVVLAGLAMLAQRNNDTGSIAGASAGGLLLAGLENELDDVNEVEVTGAGGERLVSLVRGDGRWSVTELGDYPAAASKINGLLIALAEARIVEEKTTNPEYFDRLGVESVDDSDAGGLDVTLMTDGQTRYEMVLGDAYGDGQRYARLADSDQSVLIDKNPDVARDASDWVEPEIVNIAGSRIQHVDIMHSDGEHLILSKASPDDTNFSVEAIPEGRELQYDSIANVTGNALANLTLDNVEPATAEAGDELAVIEFRSFDGLILTVTATANGDDSDNPWLSFVAAVDPTLAAQAAETEASGSEAATGSESAADASPAAASKAPADSETTADSETVVSETAAGSAEGPDVEAEAAAINARLAGWRYQIPSYKYGQLTRRMTDLLRDLPDADE